jgi:hypothetical protein
MLCWKYQQRTLAREFRLLTKALVVAGWKASQRGEREREEANHQAKLQADIALKSHVLERE